MTESTRRYRGNTPAGRLAVIQRAVIISASVHAHSFSAECTNVSGVVHDPFSIFCTWMLALPPANVNFCMKTSSHAGPNWRQHTAASSAHDTPRHPLMSYSSQKIMRYVRRRGVWFCCMFVCCPSLVCIPAVRAKYILRAGFLFLQRCVTIRLLLRIKGKIS